MKKYIIIFIISLLGSAMAGAQTMDDYFRMAADNNPGLQAKYKEYEAALQKVPQLSTLSDPVFSFGYFISPAETRLGPQEAKFSLTQMFPWFGTLKSQGDAAALSAEAKFQAFIDARNKLFFQLASAYYPLVELREWKRIDQANIDILESHKTLAYSRLKNNNGAMVDVLRVDILINEAQTDLNILEEKEKPLLATFNALLNRKLDEGVALIDSLHLPSQWMYATSDSALSLNPILKSLEMKAKAAEASKEAAVKQGLPKLGVGLDYVIVGKRSDLSPPDNGKDILMPMVSLSIPIFRAKYNAAVKEYGLMQESYLLQKEEYTNTILTNYELTSFDLQKQWQLTQLYTQQIISIEQSLRLLLNAYTNAGNDFEEVLRAQQQLLKYEKLKATAISAYYIAIAKLNYLTAKKY